MRLLDLVLRVEIAVVLLQTLWFKFSACVGCVWVFVALRVEPWGRYTAGLIELLASLLLFLPRTAIYGASISAGTMLGAIGAHLFVIGVVVQNDGGLLFGLAAAVLLASLVCLYIRRAEAGDVLKRIMGR